MQPVGYCGKEGSECRTAGHETAADAKACYERYLLNERLQFDQLEPGSKVFCAAKGCEERAV